MTRHGIRIRLEPEDSDNVESIVRVLRENLFVEFEYNNTALASVSGETLAETEDAAMFLAFALFLCRAGHMARTIGMEVRREARLGEEADDLVQRGSWPSTRRTPKSFHGLVWSSSVRFKLSEKNSGHGMTQEEFDRARTMVFVGPGHLLPGAIKAMFRPKTRHETSLEVGPGVNNLEDLTRATVPGTKIDLDKNLGVLHLQGLPGPLEILTDKVTADLVLSQSEWYGKVRVLNLVMARRLTSPGYHRIIARASGRSGEAFGLVMSWRTMDLVVVRRGGDVATVERVTGAIEQIMQADSRYFVSVPLGPDLVAKATTARAEYVDGSFDHREAFVTTLSERVQLSLQLDGAFLVGVLPSGVDPALAQGNLEKKVKELEESLSRAGAEGPRRAKRARLSDQRGDGGRGGVRGAASSFFAAVTQAMGAWFRPRTAPPEHVA